MGGESRSWALRSPHCPPVLHQLDRYRVLGRLGMGGMAEVFLVRDEQEPGRDAVIKRMLPSLRDDEELVTMFLDEARLGMRLAHPNLCRFYDAAYVDGQPCVAMEHIRGVTLEQLVERCARSGGVPRRLALAIAADVAAALDSVHRARDPLGQPMGIVHRDVTPKNIMVGFDGRVRLLDFGLAKSFASRSVTQPGTAKGKFAYLAPELWAGERAAPRTDVFALGVCLFETLVGRPLYQFIRRNDTREAIVCKPVPCLRDHDATGCEALEALVRRALAKRPEDRFDSAGELEEALRRQLVEMRAAPAAPELAQLLAERFPDEAAIGPELDDVDFGEARLSEPGPFDEAGSSELERPEGEAPVPASSERSPVAAATGSTPTPRETVLPTSPARPPARRAAGGALAGLVLLSIGGTVSWLAATTTGAAQPLQKAALAEEAGSERRADTAGAPSRAEPRSPRTFAGAP